MRALLALHHVQLAVPRGREQEARAFFVGLLGFEEETKPPNLAVRGGLWLLQGSIRLHLGVEEPFVPARKAHPAFLTDDLAGLREHLVGSGCRIVEDEPLPEFGRFYVDDPFGNRIEFLQRAATREA